MSVEKPKNRTKYNEIKEQLMDELLKTLKCAECKQIREPPLYQCKKSHLLCSHCYKTKPVCAECKSKDFPGRSYLLENMFTHLVAPCKYKESGCKFIGIGKQLIEHTKTCEFYLIPCPNASCTWEGIPNKIFEHYKEMHPDKLIRDEDHVKMIMEQVLTDDCRICSNIIKRSEDIFLLTFFIIKDKEYIEYVATNFECKFRNASKTQFTFIFPGNGFRRKRVKCFFDPSTNIDKEVGLMPRSIRNHRFQCNDYLNDHFDLKVRIDNLRFEAPSHKTR